MPRHTAKSTDALSDADLVRRIARDDGEAFEVLFGRYGGELMRYIFQFVPDAMEAEDLYQKTFIEVYRNAAGYDASISRFRTWVYTIARNLCLNEIRRRRRRHALSLETPIAPGGGDTLTLGNRIADHAASAERRAAAREQVERVLRAMESLTEADREIIHLKKFQDLPYEQIGPIVGVSAEAAKMRVHRALKKLAALVGE